MQVFAVRSPEVTHKAQSLCQGRSGLGQKERQEKENQREAKTMRHLEKRDGLRLWETER